MSTHLRALLGPRLVLLLVVLAIPLAAFSVPAAASASTSASASTAGQAADDLCDQDVPAGQLSCFAERLVSTGYTAQRATAFTAGTPAGYGPTDLQSAYALSAAAAASGSGQRVYVVDAYDDPTAEADLATYRSRYGLPACSTSNGCFQKLNQTGATSPLPAADSGWAGEIALDLDMVSAACPKCDITLIEADDASTNLFAAVRTATRLGAKYVSMSWGGSETSSETSLDSAYFAASGVAYVAASGDDGYAKGASYPATSPRVISVGGTSLSRSTDSRGWAESVWHTSDSMATGSGCSSVEAKPSWQSVVSSSTCAYRASSDVSAVADPYTGVAVYTTTGGSGWGVYGGTSAATPLIAAMYALAGAPADSTQPAAALYSRADYFHDVTSGSNGSCGGSRLCTAGTGWDGPTGLGTPNGVDGFATTSGAPRNTITVDTPAARSGRVLMADSLSISATDSGNVQPTFRATGLPTGLAISSSGVVSGTPGATGVFHVTVTATDTTGASDTAAFTWTIAAQPKPTPHSSCTLPQLADSGFESGRSGWTVAASLVKRGKTLAHSGTRYVRLDGAGKTRTDRLSRRITVPAGCRVVLSYYLRVVSKDHGAKAHDRLTVAVDGTAVQSRTNKNRSSGYKRITLDLTRYAGRTITVSWTGRENATLATAFYLDDIQLGA